MAKTESQMIDLGTVAPNFELPDTDGAKVNINSAKGEKGLLVMFICNHCPFVVHLKEAFAPVATELKKVGVGVVAINSNDVEAYPDDSPEQMAKDKNQYGYPFPYLFDESQKVARAYGAVCTPDFFMFDRDLALVYRGQFDDSRPGNAKPVDGSSILAAGMALGAGQSLTETQLPSIGCNIKWRN